MEQHVFNWLEEFAGVPEHLNHVWMSGIVAVLLLLTTGVARAQRQKSSANSERRFGSRTYAHLSQFF